MKKERTKSEMELELRKLGIDINKLGKIETINEYLNNTPGMVTAKVNQNCTLLIDEHPVNLNKSEALVMSYYSYQMARRAANSNVEVIEPHKKIFKKYFKRYRGQNLNNKRLLIWRTGGLGDICFTQPLIKYIKSKYPSCRITFGTAPNNRFIFNCWPKGLVDETIVFPFKINYMTSNDYHMTFEGAIERCTEAHSVNCYDIFKKVACLDFDINDYPLTLSSEPELKNKFQQIIPPKTILIQVRASSPIRTMGSYRWVEVAKELTENLGYNVGFIDSKNNSDLYEKFIDEYSLNRDKVFNFAKYSSTINKGIAILDCCDGMIGIDSSFTHIAAGLGKPVLGLYGPFLGILRMKYYKNCDWIDSVGYSECGKWPCFLHQDGIFECPFAMDKKPSGCLLSISKETIINNFLKLVNK